MAITPTYSWPLPDDTDLVKDGAEAIRDLGNAIDTTVSSTTGLVHIKTVSTGGAVSSINVDDCFSADYNAYRIIFNLAGSSDNRIMDIRLRVGGADETGSIYRRQTIVGDGSTPTTVRAVNESSWRFIQRFGTINAYNSSLEIYNPFEAQSTTAFNPDISVPTGNIAVIVSAYGINNSTSYTGFTGIIQSGTVNGSITVLGYRK